MAIQNKLQANEDDEICKKSRLSIHYGGWITEPDLKAVDYLFGPFSRAETHSHYNNVHVFGSLGTNANYRCGGYSTDTVNKTVTGKTLQN